MILFCYIWVFFWNFESEKFSGETKNFQAKIKIGQAELMNGQVFKSTFLILNNIIVDFFKYEIFQKYSKNKTQQGYLFFLEYGLSQEY